MDPGTDYGEPTYADLTGDGWDEAIFVEVWFSGGSSMSSFVSVYSMLPGEHRPRKVHHFGSDPRYEQHGGDTRVDLRTADANGLVLTRAVFTEDGGFRTGDMARVDDDGFIFTDVDYAHLPRHNMIRYGAEDPTMGDDDVACRSAELRRRADSRRAAQRRPS